MDAIKLKVSGFLNSFRDPYFIDYHRTLLFPPKTTLIGLAVNLMGLKEEDFYKLQDRVLVGVIVETFLAKSFDLWSVRKGKEAEAEAITQPIHREFLFKPEFTIYFSSEDYELLGKIEDSLGKPKRYPCLGRDDEIIGIGEVKKVKLEKTKGKEFRCILPFNVHDYPYNLKISQNPIIQPEVVKLPLKFEKRKKGRIGREIRDFTQFCGIKVILKDEIDCYRVCNTDKEFILLF